MTIPGKGNPTSVTGIVNNGAAFRRVGSVLSGPSDARIEVRDLGGRLLRKGRGSVDLRGIPRGVLFARCGDKVLRTTAP